MAKKRAQISGQEFPGANILAKTTTDTKSDRERGRNKERLDSRATYDMTQELKEAIVRKATDLGIPASQLAMFMLCDGLARLENGEIDPTPFLTRSESPKFRNNLAFGDWYWLSGDAG